MTDIPDALVVLTGGPGAGKTTLIEALAAAGHETVAESGRAVIRDQVAIGGRGLPWEDPALYAELMLSRDLRTHRRAAGRGGPVYFDRGLIDVIGYLRLIGEPVPAPMERAAALCRYHRRVLVAPPWPAIYRQDAERRQDFDEAARTCAAMREAYAWYGYELLEIPHLPVADRFRFVLSALGDAAGRTAISAGVSGVRVSPGMREGDASAGRRR